MSHRSEWVTLAIYLVSSLGLALTLWWVLDDANSGPNLALVVCICMPSMMALVRVIRWQSPDRRGFAESLAFNALALLAVWVDPRVWSAAIVLTALLTAANMATAGARGAIGALACAGAVLLVQALTLDVDGSPGLLAMLLMAPAVLAGLESRRLVRKRRSFSVLYLRHGLITGKLVERDGPHNLTRVLITDINPAALTMFGAARADFVGHSLIAKLPWLAYDLASSTDTTMPLELLQRRRLAIGDGRVVEVDASVLPENEITFSFTDVTDQVEAEQTIRHQAEVDTLTGLANRSVLVAAIEARLADDRRRVQPFALLMIDLNRFKEINDTFGHHVGDTALVQVAENLKRAARPCDLVARVGGDEFAAIVEQPGDTATAIEIATRFAMACEEPVDVAGMRVVTGASVGLTMAPDDGLSAETVMRCADTAMYQAKRSGDRVRAYARRYAVRDRDRFALSSQVDHAFANAEFFMLAQPKVNLRSGRVTGVELLARWQHPERGLVEPADFVDLVELAGRSADLARLALQVGIEGLARARPPSEFAATHIALNLSPRDFADHTLPQFIATLLHENDVPPSQLFLEVTENQVFDQLDSIETFLAALEEIGVSLSIDDFGTGHSNLLRLNYLPVAEIKLDKFFTDQLISSPEDSVLIRSVVELGHNLGLRVTAEGVEDHHQAEVLRRIGCDHAQGFFWAHPMPVDEAIALIGTKID